MEGVFTMPRSTETRSAPKKSDLPEKRNRAAPGPVAEARVSFDVPLVTITPVLGGSYRAREVCEWEPIRAPSIRGHLRFWWRAAHAGRFDEPQELSEAETELWGGTGHDQGTRSSVEIRVENLSDSQPEFDSAEPSFNELGAYAIFPARSQRAARGRPEVPTARRLKPGFRFRIHVSCPAASEAEVRLALRAWVLFGGYGGRTRRGVGSVSIDPGSSSECSAWLPKSMDGRDQAIRTLISSASAAASNRPRDLPVLDGAEIWAGKEVQKAIAAWDAALSWLRDFRQGQPRAGALGAHDPAFARDRGDQRRPGRSNWPEPDKVRHLLSRGGPMAHEPLHDDAPAWPRAGFGLPIIGRFQDRARDGSPYVNRDPPSFELRWEDQSGKMHDRLASPLIVKAIALATGKFVPCAIWLNRAFPMKAKVGVKQGDSLYPRSRAEFDVLVAPGDAARFSPLEQHKNDPQGERLKGAFFSWLTDNNLAKRVTP